MNAKLTLALAVAAGLLALAVWGFTEGRKEMSAEREREEPVKAPSRLSVENGEVTVSLDREAREKSGIEVAPLQAASWRREVGAYGTVLSPQALTELRNGLVAAQAQVEKTRAALQTSGREYERIEALHAEDRNVSDKALQAAEAAWRADDAGARAAQEALKALERNARQNWGGVLASAVQAGSPLFERLAQQQEALLRIAAPAGVTIGQAPRTARIQAPDGKAGTAALISPSPQTDPRLQGTSFFYSAKASELLPGMTVTAYLPVGREMRGAMVPAGAAVWWQGKAWVYVERGENKFARRELPTDNPAAQGWFAAQDFARERVVVRGAQLLLSEELRSKIQLGD